MKNNIKRIIAVIMAMTLVLAFSATAFAATTGDVLHKVNGVGKANGGTGSYQSVTKVGCYKITVQGTSDNSSLHVTITVKNSRGTVNFSQRDVVLNGKEYTLRTYVDNTGLPADTYTITVVPESSNIGYEVSTMFYYYTN